MRNYEDQEQEYFDGLEQFALDMSEIVGKLEEHQNFFEKFGDVDGEETILTFMMWLENKASDVEHIEANCMRFDDVVDDFETNIKPAVLKRYSADDSIAMREAFNDYTDALTKDDLLSEWQYNNMDNPY